MAMDFTGVTNVFMGGDVSNKTTSLQGVYHGENELWNHTDKGYRWRMMGNTINGNESFSVGDVVCFGYGTTSMWSGMSYKTAKDCIIPTNYYTSYWSYKYIDVSTTIKMGWSDEIGEDGKVIGWHLLYEDNLDFDKNMCNHAYRVAETLQNGAYAKFQTNSAYYLTTGKNILTSTAMIVEAGVSSFWGTSSGNNPLNYYDCFIQGSGGYIEGQRTVFNKVIWTFTTSRPSDYNVIFKRVKIAQ